MTQSPLAAPPPWDAVADAYVEDVAPQLARFAEDALRMADVRAGARVLDVAAGPGTLAFAAARRRAVVTAIDFSPRMIAKLVEACENEKLAIDARVADARTLPFADESFDAAFAMFALMFLPEPARGLAELRRVLRTGGVAVVTTWKPLDTTPVLGVVSKAIGELVPGIPTSSANGVFTEADDLRDAMVKAGFHEVSVVDLVHTRAFPTTERLWAELERSMPPLVLLRSKMGERWTGLSRTIASRLVATYGEGPQAVTMIANAALGRS